MMEFEVIRSNRKTIAIEIKSDGRVVVKAPLYVSMFKIRGFVREKSDWIEKNRQKVFERQNAKKTFPPFSKAEVNALKKEARKKIVPLLEEYSKIMGVIYNTVSIRAQKTRWGSCSSKGNLNFNCLLALVPEDVCRYVVIHELCHLKHMNHSKAFWSMVSVYAPDFRECRKWLKIEGRALIERIE